MTPNSDRRDRIDRLIEQVQALARQIEGQSHRAHDASNAPKPPDFWGRAAQTVGSFLLAVSLTLGVQHEAHNSPGAQMAQPVVQVAHESPLQRGMVDQLASDADRLSDWIKSNEPDGQASLSEIAAALSKDLKTIIRYPCAEDVEDEAVEVLLQLQLQSVQKVAADQPITSTEHRVKRLVTLLKNVCI